MSSPTGTAGYGADQGNDPNLSSLKDFFPAAPPATGQASGGIMNWLSTEILGSGQSPSTWTVVSMVTLGGLLLTGVIGLPFFLGGAALVLVGQAVEFYCSGLNWDGTPSTTNPFRTAQNSADGSQGFLSALASGWTGDILLILVIAGVTYMVTRRRDGPGVQVIVQERGARVRTRTNPSRRRRIRRVRPI